MPDTTPPRLPNVRVEHTDAPCLDPMFCQNLEHYRPVLGCSHLYPPGSIVVRDGHGYCTWCGQTLSREEYQACWAKQDAHGAANRAMFAAPAQISDSRDRSTGASASPSVDGREGKPGDVPVIAPGRTASGDDPTAAPSDEEREREARAIYDAIGIARPWPQTDETTRQCYLRAADYLISQTRRARLDSHEALRASDMRLHAHLSEEIYALRTKLAMVETGRDGVWRWQGDGGNEPSSLVCPVVMSDETFQRYDAVLEAARLRGSHCFRTGSHPRESCAGCGIDDAVAAMAAPSIDDFKWSPYERRLLHSLHHIRHMECAVDHDDDPHALCPARTAKEALGNVPCSICGTDGYDDLADDGFRNLVRRNAERDPTYSPYCLRCTSMARMTRAEPFLWRCACGAVHDARQPTGTPCP